MINYTEENKFGNENKNKPKSLKELLKKNYKIKSLSSNYQDFSKNNNEITFQILNENMIHLNSKINPDFIKNTFHKVLNKPTLLLENTNGKFQLVSIHSIDEAY